MTLRVSQFPRSARGSVLVIVLWIALGLVAVTLYFAQSTNFQMRAADNRYCAQAADQAIEGAARYIARVLTTYSTNGASPTLQEYLHEAVPVGESRFWLLARPTNSLSGQAELTFGLIDESSRVNLNTATSNQLWNLPGMTDDLLAAILDWRDPESTQQYQTYYAMLNPPYLTKAGEFESVEELRLLYGANMDALLGEDRNRNGVLDPGEDDLNGDRIADPGLADSLTIYSSEPNVWSNGIPRVNLNSVRGPQLAGVLEQQFGLTASRAQEIAARAPQQVRSPLEFYRASGMTAEEFALVFPGIRTSNGTNALRGRININTATEGVLAGLPGMSQELVPLLMNYRQMNPDRLTSPAWVVDALGESNREVLDQLQSVDCLTTQSFQYTADIAAVGPYGRGYRRVRYVFDVSELPIRIICRQDLSYLGWALGQKTREDLLLARTVK
jgi:type II secretory pathway component PulK